MRRRVGIFAAVCLLSLPGTVATQAEQPKAPERSAIMAAAVEVMQKARFSTLVTLRQDGHPQARIVDPAAPEDDLTVWIGTHPVTRKVGQIRADPRVTLLYFDPSGPGYVTLLARAELVTDPAQKARHWKQDWAAFYADGHRGDDFILIRCKPLRLELVSQAHGIVNDPATWRPVAIDFP